MRSLIIFTLSIFLFTSCQNKEETLSLDKALVQSFKDKKLSTLSKFFPTKAVYKLLEKEMPKRTDAEIDSFLSRNNHKLIESWNKMSQTIQEKKIDPENINIKEAIVYNPYKESSLKGMVIVYEYDNKTWDDLSLIIYQNGDSIYLLDIPNPTRAFSFSDSTLAESSQAKSAIELKESGFQQTLKNQVTELVAWAKSDNINEFGNFVIYSGDDKNRSWKSPVNMLDAKERNRATELLEKTKKATADCPELSFDIVQAEKESEGYWIVQPVNCSKKIIRFAFLKIKDKLMLGDIDVETQEK